MVRSYNRSLKGSRAKEEKPNKRENNVSLIRAVLVNKVLIFFNLRDRTDAITFEFFIFQSWLHKLWKGACVVRDNCSIYMGEVEKAIKLKGQS